jgi:hypothetical protein
MQIAGITALVTIMVVIGTLQEADMADQSPMPGPQWQIGDTWRVEYGVKVPSPAMSRLATPPPPRRTIWRYTVVGDTAAEVLLEATRQDGNEQFLITFTRDALRLKSVVRKTDDGAEAVIELDDEGPFFGWTQSQPIIFDWPLFAAAVPGDALAFTTEDEEDVEQSANWRDDGLLEVLFTAKDPDTPETVRSSQTWKPGASWWQEARITVEYADKEPPALVVLIAGRQI